MRVNLADRQGRVIGQVELPETLEPAPDIISIPDGRMFAKQYGGSYMLAVILPTALLPVPVAA